MKSWLSGESLPLLRQRSVSHDMEKHGRRLKLKIGRKKKDWMTKWLKLNAGFSELTEGFEGSYEILKSALQMNLSIS